jgi:hypothetical protein
VWTKSGQILEYGNTADSRIEVSGSATARTWALNKLTDTSGNYLTLIYTEDNPNGEFSVSRIDYSGNASSTPVLSTFASVRFFYESKPDAVTTYQNGSVFKSTKRLTNIKTYYGSNLVKDYKVTYNNTGNYHTNLANQSDGSLVSSIQECDGSATQVCLPATTFAWTGVKGGFAAPLYSHTPVNAGDGMMNLVSYGDLNGDGKSDMIFYNGNQQAPYGVRGCYISLSNGTGFINQPSWTIEYCPPFLTIGDINADGLYDLTFGRQISSGSGFSTLQIYVPPPYLPYVNNHGLEPDSQSVDLNGDGFLDTITRTYATAYDGGNRISVTLFNGSSFTPETIWTIEGGYPGTTAAHYPDLNGDGLADLVFQTYENQFWVSISNGTGFLAHSNWINFSGRLVDVKVSFADFNADGLADIVFNYGNNQFYVALSTGTGFTPASIWSTQASNTVFTNSFFIDVNGDGRADLVHQNNASQFFVALSTGNSFAPAVNWVNQVGDNRYTKANFGDVNGDGIADLIFQRTDNSFWVSLATSKADRISTITNNLGHVTSISYKPLTDSSVYVKDSGPSAATYPAQDVQSASYVVTSVSKGDGIGGTIATSYTYGGAKTDLSGRGSKGFRWVKELIPDSGLNVTKFYRQDYPFTGQLLQAEERAANGKLLSVINNVYANTLLGSTGAQSNFPYVTRNIQKLYELDGSFVKSNFTDYQYDSYGNQTQAVTTSHDGFIKTTTNQYSNDTTNWILGRLVRTSVSVNTPAAGAASPYPTSVFSIAALSSDKVEGLNAQIAGFTFTVTRSDGAGTGSVNWAVTGSGTNQANATDFQGAALPAGVISFNEGETSKTLTVVVQGDASVEPDEQFTVTLSSPAGIGGTANPVLGTTTAIGVIRNDDIASYVFNATISADTLNYNLKAAAIAAGWNQTTPLNATITVNSGIYVGSSSTANPAFDTGAGFPNGSVLQIINNGFIVGAGGKGGVGALAATAATPGLPGGPAFKAQAQIAITNNGVIGGGRGGEGGGVRYTEEVYDSTNDFYRYYTYAGCSGSGGRGYTGGLAGNSQSCYYGVAQNGTKTSSGDFGSAGYTGNSDAGNGGFNDIPAPGGAGGSATIGNANINWLQTGARYGALN